MDTLYDICVVGAGMIGSAAAWHITRLSKATVVLVGPDEPEDRESSTVYGCHYDEGRITRVADYDPILAELAKHSIDRYSSIERISGVKFYTKNGFLTIGEDNAKVFVKKTYDAIKNAKGKATFMNRMEAENEYPYFSLPEDVEIVFDHEGGNLSPRKLVSAHKKAAIRGGCDVIDDVVDDVSESADGHLVVITETGKTLRAKKVLLATGAFTTFRKLLPKDKKLDIHLKTQTVLKFELDNEERSRLSNMPSLLYLGGLHNKSENSPNTFKNHWRCYVLPPIKYPNGKYYLKLGHGEAGERTMVTEDDVCKWYQGTGSPWAAQELFKIMMSLIPDLKYQGLETDNCVTTHTKSGYLYIDMVTRNIGIAVGGNGYAAKMSDELGHIAARMIIKGGWDYHMPAAYFKAVYKSAHTSKI